MDKKNLIILIVIAAIVLVAGFFVFKYLGQTKGIDTQNSLGGANVENSADQAEIPKTQIETGGIQVEGGNIKGGLIVCLDKCGDNICQKTDPNCKENSMNCICPETHQECPQDCK